MDGQQNTKYFIWFRVRYDGDGVFSWALRHKTGGFGFHSWYGRAHGNFEVALESAQPLTKISSKEYPLG